MVIGPLGMVRHRHKISKFHHAIGTQETRNQNVRFGPVELLGLAVLDQRRNAETSALMLVENAGKDTR